MFCSYTNPRATCELIVSGIPFSVEVTDGVIRPLGKEQPRYHPNHLEFEGEFETPYFLGVAVKHWQCAEWWGQQEVQYDHPFDSLSEIAWGASCSSSPTEATRRCPSSSASTFSITISSANSRQWIKISARSAT